MSANHPLVSADGVALALGQHVRVTPRWAGALRGRGLDATADALEIGGVVVELETSPHWAVVRVRLDRPVRYHDGSGDDHETLAPADVEVRS